LNDVSAIKQIAMGDTNALTAFYLKHREDVYRLAYAMTKQRADAEDITQDVFLTVALKAYTYKVDFSEKAWLLKITRNKALNFISSRARLVPLDETLADRRFVTEAQDIGFFDILECLSFTGRQIVLFHIAYGLSHKETSKILKMSHSAVRKQYTRAMKTLEANIREGL